MNEDSIFLAALELGSPEARAAFLDQACEGNAELHESVERLLRAHARADDVLGQKAQGLPATVSPELTGPTGTQFGPYTLLEQIGEGGFGVVFMAEQQQPVRRRVALKILKPGLDTRQVIARFEQERQALALMDHPNIAKVLDAGTAASGRPFFVMELIRGVAITQYCDEHQLSPRQRLELFVSVCQAVQHAHQKGIIHRDIKSTNVMVTLHDGRPLVKVIDFGVAKATGQQLTEKTLFTHFAQMIGTPLYMSPEQAELTSQDIDTRTDIYSLGVLLYELLTGTTPFEKQRFQQAAFDEIRRIIREEEPPRPSMRLSSLSDTLPSVSALRHMEPRALTKLVRGDLDWIVMKALEKDRNRRYETANGLAMDVQHYLADEPVLACPPSAGYRLRKFARRNRWTMLTAALVAAALFLGTAVSVWQAIRATRAEVLATQNAASATSNEFEATKQAKLAKASEETAKGNERLANQRYYASQMNLAAWAWDMGDTPRVLELLETQRPRVGEEDLRAFEWYALWQLCHERLRYRRQGNPAFAHTVAYSPDSRMLAMGSSDGTVKLLDASNGEEIRTLESGGKSQNGAISFSPAGKLLAQQAGPSAEGVILWNVDAAKQTVVLADTGAVKAMAFTPDGQKLATANSTEIVLWNTATASPQDRRPATFFGDALVFSPDGKWLVTTAPERLQCWRVDSGDLRLFRELPVGGFRYSGLGFSDDGKRLAFRGSSRFQIWDSETWTQVPITGFAIGREGLTNKLGTVRTLAFVPGRDAVAFGLDALSVKVRDLSTLKTSVFAHQSPVNSIAVSPDGKSIAAIGSDAILKVWNLEADLYTGAIDAGISTYGLALTRDGRTLAVGNVGTVKLFDPTTGAPKGELAGFRTVAADGRSLMVRSLAFLGDNVTLATSSAQYDQPGELRLWDISTCQERLPAPRFDGSASALATSPDDRVLAVGGPQGELALFDLASAERLALVQAPKLNAVTFSPDGQFLICAAGADSSEITLRDPLTGAKHLTFLPRMEGMATCVCCSSDSKLVAAGSSFGPVYVWEMPGGQLRATLRGSSVPIYTVAFFPDNLTLAAGTERDEVVLWDVVTGQERATLPFGRKVAISADGKTLATAEGPKVRLLRASTAPESLARKSGLNLNDPPSPRAGNE